MSKVKFIYKKEFIIERDMDKSEINRMIKNGVDNDIEEEADEKDNFQIPAYLDSIKYDGKEVKMGCVSIM